MNSALPIHLNSAHPDFHQRLEALMRSSTETDTEAEVAAQQIIREVREYGDKAVLKYTAEFDGLNTDESELTALEKGPEQMREAFLGLPQKTREILQQAARRISSFHLSQKQHLDSTPWHFSDDQGINIGLRHTPLQRVGIYTPGGQAAYCSTVLMTAIPARAAGVQELILTSPAAAGEISPYVLAAAHLAGVDRAFGVGGAQAIAALTYGTETIPAVAKIVGPGNRFVTAAKRLVQGTVGIDMLAGPSEILIICDGNCPPDWVVLDLFAQAEHDTSARSILLCPDSDFLETVAARIPVLLEKQPRKAIISASLSRHGALIKVDNLEQACQISNRIAPEHLCLMLDNPPKNISDGLIAGAVFIGSTTVQVLGDYCAGPSHVLPTAGTARFNSVLNITDFLRSTSVIEGQKIPATLYQTAASMARMEGLEAHALSAESRLDGSASPDDKRAD